MNKDELGSRMKEYEYVSRTFLTKRMPTIVRVDGKAFHSFTANFDKPFDSVLMKTMWNTAAYMCQNIMGCKLAYVQSDEMSFLITDYDKLKTEAWFDGNIQKIASVSASMATMAFNTAFRNQVNIMQRVSTIHALWSDKQEELLSLYEKRLNTAMFDARVFVIPKEEVCNYFIWRQQDATKNSIQMTGRYHFTHKQLHEKNGDQIQEMLFQEKGLNFNDFPVSQKRGVCVTREEYCKENVTRHRWIEDLNIPIFTKDRNYIERYI